MSKIQRRKIAELLTERCRLKYSYYNMKEKEETTLHILGENNSWYVIGKHLFIGCEEIKGNIG